MDADHDHPRPPPGFTWTDIGHRVTRSDATPEQARVLAAATDAPGTGRDGIDAPGSPPGR